MALSSRFRWRLPRSCAYVLIFTAGLGAGIFVDSVRHAVGLSQYYSRRSEMWSVQCALLDHAKKYGRFPATIDTVINQVGLDKVVRADDLQYAAANMSYDSTTGTTLLFKDKKPRQYGFIRGCFWVERDCWEFQITYAEVDQAER